MRPKNLTKCAADPESVQSSSDIDVSSQDCIREYAYGVTAHLRVIESDVRQRPIALVGEIGILSVMRSTSDKDALQRIWPCNKLRISPSLIDDSWVSRALK